jgi:hypothetical protein
MSRGKMKILLENRLRTHEIFLKNKKPAAAGVKDQFTGGQSGKSPLRAKPEK